MWGTAGQGAESAGRELVQSPRKSLAAPDGMEVAHLLVELHADVRSADDCRSHRRRSEGRSEGDDGEEHRKRKRIRDLKGQILMHLFCVNYPRLGFGVASNCHPLLYFNNSTHH